MEIKPRLSVEEMIKHWLLNTAIEFPVHLGALFPTFEWGPLNVKPIPGCGEADYARGLTELFGNGMITLSSEITDDDVESERGVAQVLDRFMRLAKDNPRRDQRGHRIPSRIRNRMPEIRFKLTALGGEKWEGVAEPNWNHLFTEFSDFGVGGDLYSPNQDLLLAWMGWYSRITDAEIQLETITWQTYADYEILYWKRLPFVYHASFAVRVKEPRQGADILPPRWFSDWFSSATRWYKQPWDLPEWPSAH